MTIYPEYRGATLSGSNTAIVTKTIELRVPQSQWNIDRCDGTGTSGYNLDLSKAQMLYMDYSWYGAGAIRFGFKNSFGEIMYVHRIVNNNVNTEAFMRSGNLPARYEVHSYPVYTFLTATCGNSDTVIYVGDTSAFPSAGVLLLENEHINYSAKTSTSFTGLTRGQGGNSSIANCNTTIGSPTVTTASSITGIQAGQMFICTGIPNGTYVVSFSTGATNTLVLSQAATVTGTATGALAPMGSSAVAHTYSATAPLSVQLHSPFFSPTVSHWGTSIIMDGRFDDDKSYVFGYGMPSAISIANGATNALMAIRLGPSVDSGVISTLGNKEIVNRMQLTMRQMDIATPGLFLITLILNPSHISSAGTWVNVGGSSLAQYAVLPAGVTIVGGEQIFRFFTTPNSNNFAAGQSPVITSQSLELVRDLGNSILGGGTDNVLNGTASTPFKNIYPDGPDVLVITAQNIDGNARNIQARLSWSEAQA